MNDFTDENNLKSLYYNEPRKLKLRIEAWSKYGTNKADFFDWVISHLSELSNESTLLDAGCGSGRLLSLAQAKCDCARLYGIDFSSSMVAESKSKVGSHNKKNIMEANVENLPFAADYFDIVTATHVLYHVPDISGAIREMKRVLKPGGILFLTTTDYDMAQGLNKIHYQTLDKIGFPEFMKKKSQYLRFTPRRASLILGRHFPRFEIFHFRNDLVYHDADRCFDYYQSAMMYRNSRGFSDDRIDQKMWERLADEMIGKIKEKIKRDGFFMIKGRVEGFKAYKHE